MWLKTAKTYIAVSIVLATLLLVCAVKIYGDGQMLADNADIIAQITEERQRQIEEKDGAIAQLKQQIAGLENENSSLAEYSYSLGEHNWYLYLHNIDDDSPTLVDSRIEQSLVDLLEKHFEARYYGDEEAFDATVLNDGLMLNFFNVYDIETVANNPYYAVEVRAILGDQWILTTSQNGGRHRRYMPVLVVAQKTAESEVEAHSYSVGIEKHGGKWCITDYD